MATTGKYCCECIHYLHGVLENPCAKDQTWVGYLQAGCLYWEDKDGRKLYDDIEQVTKVCKRCGQEKPVLEFGREKRQKDGRRIYCLDCFKEILKERAIRRKLKQECE